ncbi:hypothetical protein R6Q57_018764 [Mikania cordata]
MPLAVKLQRFGEDGHNHSHHSWDKFYDRHRNKFFKDRHYLEKDWGNYFSDDANGKTKTKTKTLLEAGCGAGNTIFPFAKKYPQLYIHACDFSHHALALVKSHPNFLKNQINAFVCDIAEENICDHIMPASVDIVTLPNGHVLFRDYAIGDYAQVMLMHKGHVISKNFCFRGDGTVIPSRRQWRSSTDPIIDLAPENSSFKDHAVYKWLYKHPTNIQPILEHALVAIGPGYFFDVLSDPRRGLLIPEARSLKSHEAPFLQFTDHFFIFPREDGDTGTALAPESSTRTHFPFPRVKLLIPLVGFLPPLIKLLIPRTKVLSLLVVLLTPQGPPPPNHGAKSCPPYCSRDTHESVQVCCLFFIRLEEDLSTSEACISMLKSEKKWLIREGIPRSFDVLRLSRPYLRLIDDLTTSSDLLGRPQGMREV